MGEVFAWVQAEAAALSVVYAKPTRSICKPPASPSYWSILWPGFLLLV
jgi:hypothetical protein